MHAVISYYYATLNVATNPKNKAKTPSERKSPPPIKEPPIDEPPIDEPFDVPPAKEPPVI